MQNDVFEQWLDDETQRVLAKLKEEVEPLVWNDKLVALIGGKFRNFHDSDVELRKEIIELRGKVDDALNTLSKKTNDIHGMINEQTWRMIGILGFIIALVGAVATLLRASSG